MDPNRVQLAPLDYFIEPDLQCRTLSNRWKRGARENNEPLAGLVCCGRVSYNLIELNRTEYGVHWSKTIRIKSLAVARAHRSQFLNEKQIPTLSC